MKVMWKAACAAVLLIAATTIEIGCGDTYRPVATPKPSPSSDPAGPETEAVISCCLNPSSINAVTTTPSSVLTAINVSGATNSGNKVLGNIVGLGDGTAAVGAAENPIAFDGARTSIFTANTAADSVTQSLLNTTSGGFSAGTNTIALEAGSRPIAMSFQYYGATYTQDYVVNSGTGTATCPGTGSLGVISESAGLVKATVCIGTSAVPANPVAAWIFRDQSKVFVLDNTPASASNPSGAGHVYVVSASKYKVTNSFAVGKGPIKMAQSGDGNYIYTLNNVEGSISVIDAVAEQVVQTFSFAGHGLSAAALIDIALDPNYLDTSKNTQYNHVWILQADGTVTVLGNSTPGTLSYVSKVATGVNPTNLALLRDGTEVYVGLGGTNQIVAIDTSIAAGTGSGFNATTVIPVGVSRTVTLTPYVVSPVCLAPVGSSCDPKKVPAAKTYYMSESTVPTVTYVAVSRQGSSTSTGDSADLAKAFAITTTNTTYSYFQTADGKTTLDPTTIETAPDPNYYAFQWTLPSTCTHAPSDNVISCPNLYSGTAVVSAAANGATPINTYITTIPAPAQVTYCNPDTTLPDGPKACPLMTPIVLLGRS